jgi:hypothetical protein
MNELEPNRYTVGFERGYKKAMADLEPEIEQLRALPVRRHAASSTMSCRCGARASPEDQPRT